MTSINESDMIRFYNYLDHHTQTEIRVIDPHKRHPPKSIHVHNSKHFTDNIRPYNGTHNIYAGVNERRADGTKSEDVLEVNKAFIDVDPIREPNTVATDEQKTNARIIVQQILTYSNEMGWEKPNIIDSGNGFNIYWRIPPLKVTDETRSKINAQMMAFCKHMNEKFKNEFVKIDQTGDLARIMKVPGTLNIKGVNSPENPWHLSSIVEFDDDQKPDQKLLLFILTLPTEEKKPMVVIRKDVPLGDVETLRKNDSKLNRLLNGDISGYTSRSEAEMGLVVKLMLKDVPESQILRIMDGNPIGKWPTETQNYRDRSIERAREFANSHKEPERKVSFQEVIDVFKKWLYIEDDDDIYLLAGFFHSHRLKGDPVWIFLIGPPSDAKTEMLRAFVNGDSKLVQSLTPRTLISGYNPTDTDRTKYDLCLQLRDKILMVYDFSEILTKRKEDRNEIFAQLRGLYDGTVNRGLGNGMNITWGKGTPEDPKIYCSMIAATTPVIDNYLMEQHLLGSRHISYRKHTKNQKQILAKIDQYTNEEREIMREDIHNVTQEYFTNHQMTVNELRQDESDTLHNLIITLCQLRAGAKHDNYTNELDGSMTAEATPRVYVQIKKLLLGLKNIDSITDEKLNSIICKVIRSSIPEERVKILQKVFSYDGEERSTQDIASSLNLGRGCVKRELTALTYLGYILRKPQRVNENDKYDTDFWSFNMERLEEINLLLGGQTKLFKVNVQP